jgi:DNA-binding XRE family transcriptional regulator
LSNNLQAVRDKLGKTQTEVGVFCGVSKSAISNWEKAKELPPLMVPKLMQFLHCSREDLLESTELVMREEPTMYRTSPALKIMPKELILERLKHRVDKLTGASSENEAEHLDASEELIRDLRRRHDEAKKKAAKLES